MYFVGHWRSYEWTTLTLIAQVSLHKLVLETVVSVPEPPSLKEYVTLCSPQSNTSTGIGHSRFSLETSAIWWTFVLTPLSHNEAPSYAIKDDKQLTLSVEARSLCLKPKLNCHLWCTHHFTAWHEAVSWKYITTSRGDCFAAENRLVCFYCFASNQVVFLLFSAVAS